MLRLLLSLRMMRLLPAYIDPGAGSMLIQALIAAAVALPILFRERVAQVFGYLRRGNRAEHRPADEASDDRPIAHRDTVRPGSADRDRPL